MLQRYVRELDSLKKKRNNNWISYVHKLTRYGVRGIVYASGSGRLRPVTSENGWKGFFFSVRCVFDSSCDSRVGWRGRVASSIIHAAGTSWPPAVPNWFLMRSVSWSHHCLLVLALRGLVRFITRLRSRVRWGKISEGHTYYRIIIHVCIVASNLSFALWYKKKKHKLLNILN